MHNSNVIEMMFKQYKINKEQEEMDKLYCCYSLNLRNFLYQNGLKYELAAKNPNSDKLFWVYIKDKKLDELLTKWTTNE